MPEIEIMNEVVREEIRKQQARRRAETERARTVEASRDKLLARRLTALERRLNRRPTMLQRTLRPVVNAWAMVWAVWSRRGEIIVNFCIRRGLIERAEI